MSATPSFGTQVIGQTEKALNAILHELLDGTGLTEPHWVTLTLTAVSGGAADRDALSRRVAGALKVSDAQAAALIRELAAKQLVNAPESAASPVTLTDAGQKVHAKIRAAVTQITERLWGDLPAADLAVAGRVLSTVAARANQELAGGVR
jgi:DNA-binding MarR family transcriptional regulator